MKQAKVKVEKSRRMLPKVARDYMEKVIANPKLAREFLVGTGIYTKTGKLTRHYR